jgi:endonuclease-3
MSVHQLLIDSYGEPGWRQHLPPVDELISTILSQNTSDINRDKAFYALKDAYPDWQMVMMAPESDIRDVIRPAGLANRKAPRIQNALAVIYEEQNELTLDFLADMALDDAKNWLTDLDGVGPKTAAIVLLFSFNRPAMPVDTHVHRVTGRLGLIEAGTSAEKAHVLLEEIVNPDDYYSFHLNVIRHGREVCSARKPKCEICPLQNYCDYYQALVKTEIDE